MRKQIDKKNWGWLAAVAGGALLGVVCFATLFPAEARVSSLSDTPAKPAVASPATEAPASVPVVDLPPIIRRPVMDYVKAYQHGDCDTVIALTAWMQHRLEHVRLQTETPGASARAQDELCGRVLSRPVEGNQLRPEGIEDKYILTPAAQVKIVGADDGADDLSEPVSKRVWLEVTYPSQSAAPRDERGRPISAIRVGINVSREGYVIKAGVVGTLELDRSSVSLDWPMG